MLAKHSREEIAEMLKHKIVEQLGVDPEKVDDEAHFQNDLDADSLDLVEVIMEMEDMFGVKIDDDEAKKLETFGQAVDYILKHQDGASAKEEGEGGAPVPVPVPSGPVSGADGTTADEAIVDSTP